MRQCNRPRHDSLVARGNGGHQACHSVHVTDSVTVGAARPVSYGDSLDSGGVRGRKHQKKRKRKHKLPAV
jgi:hypothetical protein